MLLLPPPLAMLQVLSVVGQQVMTIQQALKGDNQRIQFEGSDIIVRPGFGVFITMNPGYAGRYSTRLSTVLYNFISCTPTSLSVPVLPEFTRDAAWCIDPSNETTRLYRRVTLRFFHSQVFPTLMFNLCLHLPRLVSLPFPRSHAVLFAPGLIYRTLSKLFFGPWQ